MKRSFLLSCCLTFLILSYSLMVNILPARTQLHEISTQNQDLSLKIKRAKQAFNQTQGLGSDAFYVWLNRQHLNNIRLLTVAGDHKNTHIQWEGDNVETLQLLNMLNESRFSNFNLQKSAGGIETSIDFTAIVAQENSPQVQEVKIAPQSTKKQTTKVLGVVHKNGECFRVIEMGEKVIFNKEIAC